MIARHETGRNEWPSYSRAVCPGAGKPPTETTALTAHLVSIDVGRRCPGVALWRDRRLVDGAALPNAGGSRAVLAWVLERVPPGTPWHWVAERPQHYALDLAHSSGVDALRTELTILQFVRSPEALYTPNDWKGQVPKAITASRLRTRLAHVADWYPSSDAASDVHDAIGIGAFHLGYVRRGCV